ncbi:CRISPR-associated helicase Cas3' [Methanoplanus endosymbiosus]|uniref:CRISPR-associated helicase Cas3 n=1 Tax=Methanoplanus endosymbiosus TaxID=33865 RepID=A0A9E7TMB5_9EURY|nr:CRISPR-associated helicase Cas3' [Methanoplanus endosymbiosus]UUX93121.1 CRISPR-associated helicase Cas3' [Methanoplanus endosymbiosus]
MSENFPEIVEVPTGLGKTDAIILAWLWRRRFAGDHIRALTPRRLFFCLPMRVLVEQTKDKVEGWLDNLNLSGSNSETDGNKISVTVLMGGEDKQNWDLYPERDAIIIGTQDMFLSRALNRGYGMSRYRWPTHFGLLNNDCLWVMDEIQLMGKGLSTTIQLQAFRNKIGTIDSLSAQSVWMSATLNQDWLRTVDFDPQKEVNTVLKLGDDDLNVPPAHKRINAVKTLKRADNDSKKQKDLAKEIISRHQAGTRTLVVVNTVKRATELFKHIENNKPDAELVLIHSRFRPSDRKKVVQSLLDEPGESGTITVSTQVIEAGVDVSAKVLFTELAPWSSLVQRFGRCNRYGEYDNAEIYWIDVPEKDSAPYDEKEFSDSLVTLTELEGKSVGPANLPDKVEGFVHRQIIRKKEIFELFDTTPDLTGSDIDISRYIRDSDDMDFSVFWRDIEKSKIQDEGLPHREELCSVPVSDIKNLKDKHDVWIWGHIDGEWKLVWNYNEIYPGVTLMLDAKQGGYTNAKGWDVKSKKKVDVIPCSEKSRNKFYSDNTISEGKWESVAEHTDEVCREMESILREIGLDSNLSKSLIEGARWHDSGKAHNSFQAMIKEESLKDFSAPPAAKAPNGAWKNYSGLKNPGDDERRKYFRHELASGILALQNNRSDLAAYLAAAHHGKVRGSIRSMPDEFIPSDKKRRFARGVWDGDVVYETDLGGGIIMPETEIDLSYMDLGAGENGPSWSARVLKLRDSPEIGPFRLAYLEALMKASDERASGGGKND